MEITAGLAALTKAGELAKGVFETMRTVERQQILIDFNEQLLSAQTALFQMNAKYEELIKIKGDLERQLMEKEDWAEKAAGYRLEEIAPGVFVYGVKPGVESPGPMHYLCPHCFEKRERSILVRRRPGIAQYVCHQCGYEAICEEHTPMMVSFPRKHRRLDGI